MPKRVTINLTVQITIGDPAGVSVATLLDPPRRQREYAPDRIRQLLMRRLARAAVRRCHPLGAPARARRAWPPASVYAGQAARTSRYRARGRPQSTP